LAHKIQTRHATVSLRNRRGACIKHASISTQYGTACIGGDYGLRRIVPIHTTYPIVSTNGMPVYWSDDTQQMRKDLKIGATIRLKALRM
jgi:hypothetical protein